MCVVCVKKLRGAVRLSRNFSKQNMKDKHPKQGYVKSDSEP